ncbi:MAG: hypothetical protein BHW12_02260 [Coprobacillus sp. 28_7]|nr:MAG: hypothetical protein BHW12_02260 [Coprobacillus sp. 28_7]
MKKMLTLFLLLIAIVCSGCVLENEEVKTYPLLDNTNEPTIDFLQPWAFYNKTSEELDKHFEELKTRGFKTIIIQNTSKYNKGEPKECFYDSEKSFPLEKKDFLKKIITICNEKNINVICGISSDDYWWSQTSHEFDEETMNMFNEEETFTIGEILAKYKIQGIYYSNEMYSNSEGFIKSWTKNINKIIEYIEKIDPKMPFYLSPFNSSFYGGSEKQKLSFWKEFFQKINFRKFDYFLLQDGFGALSKDPTTKKCEDVYNLNVKIRSLCLEYSKVNFALNIELFASKGLASDDRVNIQKKYANTLGDVIACFSVSHYYIEGGKNED